MIAIVEGREGAPYLSLFDFSTRVNLKDCNKRVLEVPCARRWVAQFWVAPGPVLPAPDTRTGLWWNWRSNMEPQPKSRPTAPKRPFRGEDGAMDIPEPPIPECEPWASMDLLNKEREIVGVYISGHPLDKFRLEVDHLCAKDGLARQHGTGKRKDVDVQGLITAAEHRISKYNPAVGLLRIGRLPWGPRIPMLWRITWVQGIHGGRVDGHRDHV